MHNHPDFWLNLAWFIPLVTFLAFVAVPLLTYRNRKLSHSVVIGAIAIAFVLAQIVFWRAVTLPVGGGEHAYESPAIHWLSAGLEQFDIAVYIDPAATVMLFMVPLVCMMIFIYSVGYMNFGTDQVDPRYSRFFSYMSLFATGMLGMVIFNNLLAFFLFWEIMGTCSYLLIGFWYEKTYPDPDKITPKEAGLKAFLVTKIGDLFFMLGLALLYAEVGSLRYRDIFALETLEHLANTPFLGTSMATVIALLLFGGTIGKSAQFPLHVWLPDAMEGPTPVSALIHAATMVSAGVFLVVRAFPIFQAADIGALAVSGIPFVAFIGALTAFGSSIIAVAQDDIKGVLAFSTISQLGYMIAALGIGAYVAGAFHLITHAFFKALLFLSSGSVIHGIEHGHHHAHEHHDEGHGDKHGEHHEEPWFNPNDMMNMGGLAKRMPRTFWPFLLGGLALSGFPVLTAGFWSKDEILAQAWGGTDILARTYTQVIFWTLAVAAGLTAFYTMRQLCLTFAGEPRTEAAKHAPESVPSMTVPLAILAVFAVCLGWVGIPEGLTGGAIPNWFHHFVISTIETGGHEAEHSLRVAGHLSEVVHAFEWAPMLIGTGFGLGGLLLGWLVYGWKPLKAGEMDRVEAAMYKLRLGWFYRAMENRFYGSNWLADLFDKFDYGQPVQEEVDGHLIVVKRPHGIVDGAVNLAGAIGRGLSFVANWLDANVVDGLVNLAGWVGRLVSKWLDVFDLGVVDGIVNGVGVVLRFVGGWFFRPIQTGRVQSYLLAASVAILVLVLGFLMIYFLPAALLEPVILWLLGIAVALMVIYLVIQLIFQLREKDKESMP
jgi:NADH-quinone oxidoreductase subunit L